MVIRQVPIGKPTIMLGHLKSITTYLFVGPRVHNNKLLIGLHSINFILHFTMYVLVAV